ncbi:MAG TPA: hypothetical protein VMU87_13490 [Stellaceae bacterium]|nr:hypothetical protein [Stellaceae bacterium]
MNRVLGIELLQQLGEIVGIGVEVVAVPQGWLERPWPRRSWAIER